MDLRWVEVAHGEDLDQEVFPEGQARVDPLDNRVGARVLEGGAPVLDGLSEHGHDKVAVEDVLSRIDVLQGDVSVVLAVEPVAVLLDLDVGRAGRDPHHRVVTILRTVEQPSRLKLAGGFGARF